MPSIAEQIDALEPAILRVYRDSDQDIGYREALLYLDGQPIGSVEFKQVLEIPIRAGSYVLHAHNRVFRSQKIAFDVKPGERISFQTANVGGGWYIFFMMLAMGVPRIKLWRETAEHVEGSGRPSYRTRHVL